MKYLSLFSGIGGFELGIQQAYENHNEHAHISEESIQEERTQGGVRSVSEQRVLLHSGDRPAPLCIGYSEIDKYASAIYQKHFPSHHNYGDITKIAEHTLPDFDLLVGGFPCQAFSIAGKRKGFEDTRGTLFFDIARVLRAKRPRLLLLENVKGLLNHDNGRTFSTIIATLTDLGYDLQWQVLNSKNHGVPQNRERVFIVGHLRGEPRPKVFPFTRDHSEADALQGHVSNTLTARYYGAQAVGTYIGEGQLNAQARVGTLRTHKDGEGFREMKSGVAPTVPARAREDGSGQGVVFQNTGIRRLTPTECERLQGFPDGWTEGVSDTQRYKTLGNAVTVNVIRDIMSKLYPHSIHTCKKIS